MIKNEIERERIEKIGGDVVVGEMIGGFFRKIDVVRYFLGIG